MGYYIQVPNNKNKAEQIVALHEGQIIPKPNKFTNVPESKGLICVIDNGPFEAAAFIYSEGEFKSLSTNDGRPRKWVLIDLQKAKQLSGYTG